MISALLLPLLLLIGPSILVGIGYTVFYAIKRKTYKTKYIRYPNGYCSRLCPFTDDPYGTCLGSAACDCCISFISNNRKKKIIKCKGVCDV